MQQQKKLRLIMVVCLVLSTFSSLYSQVIDSKQYNYVGNWYRWQGGSFITNLNLPKVTATTGRDTGAIRYALADSSVYVWTGSQWRQVTGSGAGSTDSSVFATRYYTQQTFVPYTGATGSVNLGAFGLTTDRLVLNQAPTLVGGVGIVRWNDTDGTLEFGMKGGNVTQQIGQELPVRMRNNTGSTILNGEAVYISGSTGSSTTISKAKADASLTSKTTIGILTEDIPNGQSGYVTTFGKVRDINTSALTEGELVYLSATTAGGLTSIAPTGDTYVVIIGVCERSHAVNGVVFVNVDKQYIRQYEIDTSVARIDSILDTKLSYHLINGATNLGSGAQVFKDTSSNKINLRSIIGTNGITATQNANDITISGNADSSAARVRSGTYATRIAISSPEDGEIFTQTDRLSGMYIYNQGTWRFQGDPLYFWYYTNFTRGQTVNTAAEGYNTGPLALTGAASTDFIVNQKPYSDGWLRALLKASDVTITVPGFDSLEVDSVIIWHETEILVDAVSDGTDSYGVSWGYDNAAGSYTSGDRIVLRYNHSASSGNWESRTVAAGSGTWTTKDTGVPFVAGTRMKLAIEIDGYARVIRFYINDALVTTHTSPDNVPFPNATTLVTGISPSMFNFDRLAGSTTRSFEVNYMFGYIIKKNF